MPVEPSFTPRHVRSGGQITVRRCAPKSRQRLHRLLRGRSPVAAVNLTRSEPVRPVTLGLAREAHSSGPEGIVYSDAVVSLFRVEILREQRRTAQAGRTTDDHCVPERNVVPPVAVYRV